MPCWSTNGRTGQGPEPRGCSMWAPHWLATVTSEMLTFEKQNPKQRMPNHPRLRQSAAADCRSFLRAEQRVQSRRATCAVRSRAAAKASADARAKPKAQAKPKAKAQAKAVAAVVPPAPSGAAAAGPVAAGPAPAPGPAAAPAIPDPSVSVTAAGGSRAQASRGEGVGGRLRRLSGELVSGPSWEPRLSSNWRSVATEEVERALEERGAEAAAAVVQKWEMRRRRAVDESS